MLSTQCHHQDILGVQIRCFFYAQGSSKRCQPFQILLHTRQYYAQSSVSDTRNASDIFSMSTESRIGIDIPPHEGGWEMTIQPPPKFPPDVMPYPIVIELPGMIGELPNSGKVWQATTVVYRLDDSKPGKEGETEWRLSH